MAKGKKNIASTVEELISPVVVDEMGYDIWDVEYVKEGASWYLRITIDSENGIDIDDCEKVHRAVDPIIEEADPIEGFYYLEVSSPGIERNIRVPEHYEACIGCEVQLKLFSDVNGKKEFIGELTGISEDHEDVTLLVNGESITIKRNMISKANVYYDFDSELNG